MTHKFTELEKKTNLKISGFTQTYILENQETEIIGIICSGMKDRELTSFSQQNATDKNCYIHRIKDKDDILVVQCKVDISPEQAFSWTQEVSVMQ